MRLKNVLTSKLLIGALGGILALGPSRAKAIDLSKSVFDIRKTNGSLIGSPSFYGVHYPNSLETKDSYDQTSSLSGNPDGSQYFRAYTDIGTHYLTSDYRPVNSLTDFNVNLRYVSSQGDFTGDVDITCDFESGGTTYIDPRMFYTGEVIAEAAYTTNNVRQSQKLGLLANRDSNGDVKFNRLEGLIASDGDDFVQFNIHREPNKILYRQPTNGTISVVDSSDAAITNGQWLTYEEGVDVSVNADENHDLYRFAIETTDKLTGNRSTNDFLLPPGTTSFTTNLSAVGQTQLQITCVLSSPTHTTNGIPYTWLDQYGITNHTDSVETEDPDDDGHNNLQEYIADTNPTNPASIFYASLTAGSSLSLHNTSTSRTYGVNYIANLTNTTWIPYTNNITGSGTNISIPTTTPGFYQGKVSNE